MYDRGEIMSEEERLGFINWVCEHVNTLTTHREGLIGHTFYRENKEVPQIVWTILDRIIDKEDLHPYRESYDDAFFKKYHSGRTGVYRDHVAIIFPGKNIVAHTDVNQPGLIHSRFNVFFQVPTDGGKTFYGDDVVEVKERGYVLCRSGIDTHWTEIIKGHQPRITISYGFQLPAQKLNDLYKIPWRWSWVNFKKYIKGILTNRHKDV
jgi:hypothetical protein